MTRPPDFTILQGDRPYLMRWFVIPHNRFMNVYLHLFVHSDDDRALHDHPWANLSYLLVGTYIEHRLGQDAVARYAGDIVARRATAAHRIELTEGAALSLFFTGPKIREWGFWCSWGWRPWKEFVDADNTGKIGRGCD